MADEPNKFTHIGIEKQTQRKISILAKALETNIYSMVGFWADHEWNTALKAGLVTDAMLGKPAEKSTKIKVSA